MDSRLLGSSHDPWLFVDSRFRGNDGNRRLEHMYSLDTPSATAGTDPLVLDVLRGNNDKWNPVWPPSFPRKRESMAFVLTEPDRNSERSQVS